MGGLTWDALLCTRWWVGGMGMMTRGGWAKRRLRAPQSRGGSVLGESMQTPAFTRLGVELGRVDTSPLFSTVTAMLVHCWDSVLGCMPWGCRQGRGWSEPQEGGRGWGRAGAGKHPTHQQGRAVDQIQVVVKGLQLLLPGERGPGCWHHRTPSQLLKVLVPGK